MHSAHEWTIVAGKYYLHSKSLPSRWQVSVSRSNSGMASQQNLMAHPLTVCEHFQNSPPVLQRIMSLMQSHLHATVILAHEEKDYGNSCAALNNNNYYYTAVLNLFIGNGREPLAGKDTLQVSLPT